MSGFSRTTGALFYFKWEERTRKRSCLWDCGSSWWQRCYFRWRFRDNGRIQRFLVYLGNCEPHPCPTFVLVDSSTILVSATDAWLPRHSCYNITCEWNVDLLLRDVLLHFVTFCYIFIIPFDVWRLPRFWKNSCLLHSVQSAECSWQLPFQNQTNQHMGKGIIKTCSDSVLLVILLALTNWTKIFAKCPSSVLDWLT